MLDAKKELLIFGCYNTYKSSRINFSDENNWVQDSLYFVNNILAVSNQY